MKINMVNVTLGVALFVGGFITAMGLLHVPAPVAQPVVQSRPTSPVEPAKRETVAELALRLDRVEKTTESVARLVEGIEGVRRELTELAGTMRAVEQRLTDLALKPPPTPRKRRR